MRPWISCNYRRVLASEREGGGGVVGGEPCRPTSLESAIDLRWTIQDDVVVRQPRSPGYAWCRGIACTVVSCC